MDYFDLVPKDQRWQNWILFSQSMKYGLRVRDRYADSVCVECGKVNELSALNSGIDCDVIIKSKLDYLLTDDGIICASRRLIAVLHENSVVGFTDIPLPGDKSFSVLVPNLLVDIHESELNLEFIEPKCSTCDRYREVIGTPYLLAMDLPKNPLALFYSKIWMENERNRVTWFRCTGLVANILKQEKIRGVEFEEC